MKKIFRIAGKISTCEVSSLIYNGDLYIIVGDELESDYFKCEEPDAVEIDKSEFVDVITLFLTELKNN